MTTSLVYGYGQLKDGRIDEQTAERCGKALALYKSGKIQKLHITVSAQKNGILMGQEMKRFFLDRGVSEKNVVLDPRGGNTAGETDVFLGLIRASFSKKKRVRIIPVSTRYHIPRIFWLWLARGYLVKPAISWRKAHWRDLKIEPLKLLNSILRPISSSKKTDS